jgi:cyclopropane-fatty-acyl-phospholipid synthase
MFDRSKYPKLKRRLGSNRQGSAHGSVPVLQEDTKYRGPRVKVGTLFLLCKLLRRGVQSGELVLVDAYGQSHRFGQPGALPFVRIKLHNAALHWKLILNSGLHFGEGYINGAITLEEGSVRDLAEIAARNVSNGSLVPMRLPAWLRAALRSWQQHNPVRRARANAAHHYDRPDRLYELFLDADRQYSCAYFTEPGQSLEVAQENKKRHIARKLLLAPRMRVLDIGSGWGGLALHLAATGGADVTGLTLSREQLRAAEARTRAAGLAGQVRFHLRDYREESGTYDRIVSVGMFEHVGVGYYEAFSSKLKALLRPDGVALIHSIGRMDGPGLTNPWLQKYIFPGGYVPALSEVLPIVERLGFWVTDVEILRLHYADTLKEWHARFERHRGEIADLYGEQFCRMWELYLTSAEMEFRHQKTMVFQLQLTKAVDALPITRDYMFDNATASQRAGIDDV